LSILLYVEVRLPRVEMGLEVLEMYDLLAFCGILELLIVSSCQHLIEERLTLPHCCGLRWCRGERSECGLEG
jgi:hypothetical protein